MCWFNFYYITAYHTYVQIWLSSGGKKCVWLCVWLCVKARFLSDHILWYTLAGSNSLWCLRLFSFLWPVHKCLGDLYTWALDT